MQQHHQKGFFQFFDKYPMAERRDYGHQDGKTSLVAVALFDGEPDEAFAAVYEPDGTLVSEEWLNRESLEQFIGSPSVGHVEVLSRLTELVQQKASSLIVKN